MIYSLFHPLMVSWSCHDTNVPLQKITLFILIECKKHPLHSQPCAAEAGETKPNELHANLGKWRTAIFSKQKLTASFLILFEAPTDSFLKTRLLCPQRWISDSVLFEARNLFHEIVQIIETCLTLEVKALIPQAMRLPKAWRHVAQRRDPGVGLRSVGIYPAPRSRNQAHTRDVGLIPAGKPDVEEAREGRSSHADLTTEASSIP